MKNFLLALLFLLAAFAQGIAQDSIDTARRGSDADSVAPVSRPAPLRKPARTLSRTQALLRDSSSNDSVKAAIRHPEGVAAAADVPKLLDFLKHHPYYFFNNPPIVISVRQNAPPRNESMFYFLTGLLLYFALIKIVFNKYLSNLMALFFRVTMRQQQLREQVLQTPLPSLLLNILFVVSSGFYLCLLAFHYDMAPIDNIWLFFGWCCGFVSIIYIGKFVGLKVTGWIFNIANATDTYIFVVFLVNKMIGIFLLPFLVLMAYPNSYLNSAIISLSYVMVIGLFIYRFFISFRSIRNELDINLIHFFLYLCAFEIAPLLLIYKVLLAFAERSF